MKISVSLIKECNENGISIYTNTFNLIYIIIKFLNLLLSYIWATTQSLDWTSNIGKWIQLIAFQCQVKLWKCWTVILLNAYLVPGKSVLDQHNAYNFKAQKIKLSYPVEICLDQMFSNLAVTRVVGKYR